MRVKQNRLGDSLRTVSLIIKQKGYIIKNIMNCMKKKTNVPFFFVRNINVPLSSIVFDILMMDSDVSSLSLPFHFNIRRKTLLLKVFI